MSTEIGLAYGSVTSLSIASNLASLANNSAIQSGSFTNTDAVSSSPAIGFEDVFIQVEVETGASGVSSSGFIALYVAVSIDGGSTFTGGASGTAGSYTITGDEIPLGIISANANGTKFYGGPFSLRAALGYMPQEWSIIVYNQTGATLNATSGNHLAQYQGTYTQTT